MGPQMRHRRPLDDALRVGRESRPHVGQSLVHGAAVQTALRGNLHEDRIKQMADGGLFNPGANLHMQRRPKLRFGR